ncbi:hypothetical protein C8Q75DRAFT_331393 [Abortiporus biennis]|nr:hypothetical protein C8Q75DRAFT_331393 [Abortiporus biennis]
MFLSPFFSFLTKYHPNLRSKDFSVSILRHSLTLTCFRFFEFPFPLWRRSSPHPLILRFIFCLMLAQLYIMFQ